MILKKLRKSIVYFLGWQAILFFSLTIRRLPTRWLHAFARFAGGVGYRLAGKHRRIALEGLSQAFGKDVHDPKVKKIARDCFIAMAQAGGEFVHLLGKSNDHLRKTFHTRHEQYLKNAIAKGNGVILVSAHMGNFPYMLARLSLDGYKTAAIMRPLKDKRVERFFSNERDRYGIRTINTIPRGQCVATALRSLRNNEVMFLPLDQNFGTAGVFVDFFGRKAATATGPVIFAQRTNAAIVPCFVIRQPDDTNAIIFEPEMELVQGSTEEETIAINIQRLTNIIEKYIRKYPAQWSWIHRRWKAQMPSMDK